MYVADKITCSPSQVSILLLLVVNLWHLPVTNFLFIPVDRRRQSGSRKMRMPLLPLSSLLHSDCILFICETCETAKSANVICNGRTSLFSVARVTSSSLSLLCRLPKLRDRCRFCCGGGPLAFGKVSKLGADGDPSFPDLAQLHVDHLQLRPFQMNPRNSGGAAIRSAISALIEILITSRPSVAPLRVSPVIRLSSQSLGRRRNGRCVSDFTTACYPTKEEMEEEESYSAFFFIASHLRWDRFWVHLEKG